MLEWWTPRNPTRRRATIQTTIGTRFTRKRGRSELPPHVVIRQLHRPDRIAELRTPQGDKVPSMTFRDLRRNYRQENQGMTDIDPTTIALAQAVLREKASTPPKPCWATRTSRPRRGTSRISRPPTFASPCKD